MWPFYLGNRLWILQAEYLLVERLLLQERLVSLNLIVRSARLIPLH